MLKQLNANAGAGLRALQDQSGVQSVSVDKQRHVVVLRGDQDAVAAAVRLLGERTEEYKREHVSLPCPPALLSALAGRGGDAVRDIEGVGMHLDRSNGRVLLHGPEPALAKAKDALVRLQREVEESGGERAEEPSTRSHPDHDVAREGGGVLRPVSRRLSASLQPTAAVLQRRLSETRLNEALQARPPPQDVHAQLNTGHDDNVSPALWGARKQLQRRMSSDRVAHLLDSRPDVEELEGAGLHKGFAVAPGIQARCATLQRGMSRASLSYLLATRPQPSEVAIAGILPAPWWSSSGSGEGGEAAAGPMAASVQHRRPSLQRELTKNKLNAALLSRPEPRDFRAGVLPHAEVDECLAPRRAELQAALRRNSLSKGLQARPRAEQLRAKGILRDRSHSPPRTGQSPPHKARKTAVGASPSPLRAGGKRAAVPAPAQVRGLPSPEAEAAASARAEARRGLERALRACYQLAQDGLVDHGQRAALKALILKGDVRVGCALQALLLDRDEPEFLDTMYRLALLTASK